MSVAKTYAMALYSVLSSDVAAQERAQSELSSVAEVLASRADLRAALGGPVTTPSEKKAVLAALCSKLGCHAQVEKFLDLMVKKGRITEVGAVALAFRAVRVESEGGVMGTLESADPISDADLADLSGALGRRLGRKVSLVAKVNSELLAGLRVNVLGTTYDGSLRSQLQRLKQKFLNTSTTHQ
jgi:F-type H+-transporting ATPase subunit delta